MDDATHSKSSGTEPARPGTVKPGLFADAAPETQQGSSQLELTQLSAPPGHDAPFQRQVEPTHTVAPTVVQPIVPPQSRASASAPRGATVPAANRNWALLLVALTM